jgi:DinB superfamily
MKKLASIAIALWPLFAYAQESKLWTEADRKYLLDNLTQTRNALVAETEKLSEKQYRFKESPDRWSINEVVEHLTIYELLFDQLISQTMASKEQPDVNKMAKPDSAYFNFIMEGKPHFTDDYTKPFTYAQPMGLNPLKNNLRTTPEDLRLHYLTPDRPNAHQIYIWAFGHIERGLRQIRKVKQHPNYPK